jgi:HlyD family secretion protein
MKNKILKIITKHKIIFGIVVIVLVGGGYYSAKAFGGTTAETRYVLATVEKSTLITTVSGSGQISASNQVDVKSKVSGDVLSVSVKNGDEVKAGAILAQLDSQDAYKTVRDAVVNLESAKISLEKLKKPATDLNILQAENSLTSAKNTLEKLKFSQPIDYQKALDAKEKAKDNLDKSYEDAFNDVADAFLDLPTVMSKLNSLLFGTDITNSENTLSQGSSNYSSLLNTVDDSSVYKDSIRAFETKAETDYNTARLKYDNSFNNYKNASRFSSSSTIETLFSETLEVMKLVSQAAKTESNFLDAWVDYRTQYNQTVFSKVKTYQTDISSYISQTNSHLTSLLSTQRTLQDNKEALISAENNIKELDQNNPLDLVATEASVKEKTASLANLKAGADALDIQTQQLTIKQRENSLYDAQVKLADYSIKAPFDGVVAKVSVKKGDSTSSGGVIATLITKQSIAEISLNEVDAAKIKVGQKVTLTFDAVEDLSITGKVAEIDSIGTVSQGVVTYNVKIIFDTQDARVKSGMSVSATITTNAKQNVLIVANSAIKSSGNTSYVEMLNNVLATSSQAYADAIKSAGITSATLPKQQIITVGLANDTETEIISGLKEGDQIIIRTVSQTSAKTTQTSGQSLFQVGGNRNSATTMPTAGR